MKEIAKKGKNGGGNVFTVLLLSPTPYALLKFSFAALSRKGEGYGHYLVSARTACFGTLDLG